MNLRLFKNVIMDRLEPQEDFFIINHVLQGQTHLEREREGSFEEVKRQVPCPYYIENEK